MNKPKPKITTDEDLGLKLRDESDFDFAAEGESVPYPEPEDKQAFAVLPTKKDLTGQKQIKKIKKEQKASPAKADKNDAFGLRLGSVRSRAAELYAQEEGATLQEVKEKVGSIQFNVLRLLQGRGWSVTSKKEAGDNNRNVTRYWLKKA